MRNIMEADRALVEKPLLATSAERILILNEIKNKYDHLCQPLRFAATLSELLDRVSAPVEPWDLIAGRCVDRELTAEEEALFQAFIRDPANPRPRTFLGSGHCTYSWELLVRNGLPGLREMARQAKEKYISKEDCPDFYTGILQIYDALERYMLRYATRARELGNQALADALCEAATETPHSFRAALQLLWIVTLIACAYITENPTLTVGRLDQILYPLYQKDVTEGRLTASEAEALITDYYCKFNLIMGRGEHQMGDETNSTTFKRICNFDAPEYLLLAGTDVEGKPAVNELTMLFARAIRPSFKNPVVVVRYFSGLDRQFPDLWRVLTEKAMQSASLMFYNDDNTLRTYAYMGIPEEDARDYDHFGCNWPALGHRSSWMQGGPGLFRYEAFHGEEDVKRYGTRVMNLVQEPTGPEIFMNALRACADREDLSVELLYREFFKVIEELIDWKLSYISWELEVRQRKPAHLLSFGDCICEDALTTGGGVFANAKYHFRGQSFMMFGTTADCFTAVDQLVFRQKKLTIAQLLEAVDANFEGYPQILALCRGAEKYGSDQPLSNAHVRRLSQQFCELVIAKSRPYLEKKGLFLTPSIQCDTWHLKKGADFGATPDGRLAGTAFSQNIRPANGAAINGLTGLFNSVLCLPTNSLLSGALNLDINPREFAGEEGRALFAALLGTYFNRGGLHAQVSCVDAALLRQAQKEPQQHRDLRVRVTGYSGVFVDICKQLQDDIIERLDT